MTGVRVAIAELPGVGARALHARRGRAGLGRTLSLLAYQGFPLPQLLEATRRATRHGAPPLDVLRTEGGFGEAAITQALADALGTDAALTRSELEAGGALAVADPDAALATGVIHAPAAGGGSRVVIAVRGVAVGTLDGFLERMPEFARRVTLVPAGAFAQFVRDRCRSAILAFACRGPAAVDPAFASGRLHLAIGPLALALIGFVTAVLTLPETTARALELTLSAIFLGMGSLRLGAALVPRLAPKRAAPVADEELPDYTILVPLFREARVVRDLARALARLDYPAAKLDIRLLLEEDDIATRMAVGMLELGPPFQTVLVPAAWPRTKPKALNVGLVGARDGLLVVYDAEDRPEPDQLRRAAAAFRRSPETACLQAALAIDNAEPRWIARLFALEYAANFDALLPALERLDLPLPLGGSSNHFRVEALRRAGAWDPENVTEDADLGFRFARLGYRCGTLASTTFEEAPADLMPWIRQRTRWMKGFMVTWAVHARSPKRLAAELGWRRALVVQLLSIGVPLAAVAHLALLVIVPIQLLAGTFFAGGGIVGFLASVLTCSALSVGYLGALALFVRGAVRRRRPDLLLSAPLLPVYWMLLGAAALRAVRQLGGARRAAWEKTEHGKEPRRLGPGVRAASASPRRLRRGFASG
jgi:cellulose synthase/poly-beta-1,6-N-acetylglucosamine synthase-like glycosyltransferase